MSVDALEDLLEDDGETVVVTFAAPTGYEFASSPSAAVTIHQLPSVTIEKWADTTEGSSEDPGQFLLKRHGYTTGGLTVFLSVTGTATAGTDYVALPTQVTFAPGETEKFLNVLSLSDEETEGDETVVAAISGMQVPGSALLLPPGAIGNSAVLLIREISACGVIPGVNLATAANKGRTTFNVGNAVANGTEYEATTTKGEKVKMIMPDPLADQPQAVKAIVAARNGDIAYNCHGYSLAHGVAVTMPDGKVGTVIIQDDVSVQNILDSKYEQETDGAKIKLRFDAGERLVVMFRKLNKMPDFAHSAVATKIDIAGIKDKLFRTIGPMCHRKMVSKF